MAKPRTRPLNAVFGVEIFNIDLSVAVVQGHYPEIRAAFETHFALLFRDQDLAPENHKLLAEAFEPLENRDAPDLEADESFVIPALRTPPFAR